MFIRVRDIKLSVNADEKKDLICECAKRLHISKTDIIKHKIFKKSIDARHCNLSYIYTVDLWIVEDCSFSTDDKTEIIEKETLYEIPKISHIPRKRPVIVGLGPAGLFCALILSRTGLKPIIIERGKCIEQRIKDVESFFRTGLLNINSNIQFGEGGAGTFSDGKLNTLVKDNLGRGRFILSELVNAGAPKEILYINKPHVGTDYLRCSIQNIRKELEDLGAEILFEHSFCAFSQVNNMLCAVKVMRSDNSIFNIETDTLFLGIGHSARDTFIMLKENDVNMIRKPFSVGVRIEHKQSLINDVQYGGVKNQNLPAADYKLVCHTSSGRSVYSFCMCPGGEVVAAASEDGMVVTNGMSYFARKGENANSALLVEVKPEDFHGTDPLAGMYFQRELEKAAFAAGGGKYVAPAQTVQDFLYSKGNAECAVKPTYSRGVKFTKLSTVFPEFVTEALKEALVYFNRRIKGFAGKDAVMTAVESRSSSPVRIVRDEQTMQSNVGGIYPIGEGAGYAGGIMSAAMDGMKAAEKYICCINSGDYNE